LSRTIEPLPRVPNAKSVYGSMIAPASMLNEKENGLCAK